jgi:hypothetical protein
MTPLEKFLEQREARASAAVITRKQTQALVAQDCRTALAIIRVMREALEVFSGEDETDGMPVPNEAAKALASADRIAGEADGK